ncbi:hypothetical protein GCM10007856_34860 [Azospirillum oryzae]|nr:hypothetical protein GCM10007856_34860 [Azospirillum oryzae]
MGHAPLLRHDPSGVRADLRPHHPAGLALETGAANPTVTTLERLARPFGLTVGLIPELPAREPGAKEPGR